MSAASGIEIAYELASVNDGITTKEASGDTDAARGLHRVRCDRQRHMYHCGTGGHWGWVASLWVALLWWILLLLLLQRNKLGVHTKALCHRRWVWVATLLGVRLVARRGTLWSTIRCVRRRVVIELLVLRHDVFAEAAKVLLALRDWAKSVAQWLGHILVKRERLCP